MIRLKSITKDRNQHTIEMEAQPPHMTFRPHHIHRLLIKLWDFGIGQLYIRK